MVVGKAPGGGNLVVGGGDGGAVPPEVLQDPKAGVSNQGPSGMGAPQAGQVGFGNAAPPAYGTGLGESLGGQSAFGPSGQDPYGKR